MAEANSRRKLSDIREDFPFVILYREDFEELSHICDIYKLSLKIDTDEYEFNGVNGLDDVSGRRFSKMTLQSRPSGLWIHLDKYNSLSIDASSPENIKSSYTDIMKFLSSKKRSFYWFHYGPMYYALHIIGSLMLVFSNSFDKGVNIKDYLLFGGMFLFFIAVTSFAINNFLDPHFYDRNYLTNQRRADKKHLTSMDAVVSFLFPTISAVLAGVLLYFLLPRQ